MRMSCPHTSPQNGRVECIIRSTNDIMRPLMFQASLPTAYWVEALHMTTYLLNLHPTKTLSYGMPHFSLFSFHPDLSSLVFLGASVILTCRPQLPTNLHHAPPYASFLGIRPNTRNISVLISHLIVSSYCGMSRLMKPLFHLLRSPPRLHLHLISYRIWTVYLGWSALLLLRVVRLVLVPLPLLALRHRLLLVVSLAPYISVLLPLLASCHGLLPTALTVLLQVSVLLPLLALRRRLLPAPLTPRPTRALPQPAPCRWLLPGPPVRPSLTLP
jgi:hypothetical protein